MEYLCKVGTPSGEVLERTFTASDEGALRSELEQQGYYLFSIRRGLAGAAKAKSARPSPSLSSIEPSISCKPPPPADDFNWAPPSVCLLSVPITIVASIGSICLITSALTPLLSARHSPA